jgi:hypothetical protein
LVRLKGDTGVSADTRCSDDINKFLWMVRIAQGVWPDEVQEANYFTQRGEYAVDDRA